MLIWLQKYPIRRVTVLFDEQDETPQNRFNLDFGCHYVLFSTMEGMLQTLKRSQGFERNWV